MDSEMTTRNSSDEIAPQDETDPGSSSESTDPQGGGNEDSSTDIKIIKIDKNSDTYKEYITMTGDIILGEFKPSWDGVITAISGLKLRTQPQALKDDSNLIAVMPKDSSVKVLFRATFVTGYDSSGNPIESNPWYCVEYNGTKGWSSSNYVSPAFSTSDDYRTEGYVDPSNLTEVGDSNIEFLSNEWYKELGDLTDEQYEQLLLEEQSMISYSKWSTAYADSESGRSDEETANYYKNLAFRYMFSLGAPMKYNMDIDPQYDDEYAPGMGRVVNKTYMVNPAIMSIMAGTVQMFPNLIGSQQDGHLQILMDVASNAGDQVLLDKLQAGGDTISGAFSGRLYKFIPQFNEYATYVNALCRAVGTLLKDRNGVPLIETNMPNTGVPMKKFDFAEWTIRKNYTPHAPAGYENQSVLSIFTDFGGFVERAVDDVMTLSQDTKSYINFFIMGPETEVSETISSSVTNGPLDSVFNQLNTFANQLNYFTGSGFDVGSDADARSALEASLGDSSLKGMMDIGLNFLKGGQMVLPKMVEGSTYGKSVSVSLRFVSPYGDPMSIFLKCLVPICHLLALALPRQLSDSMYSYPFLVRSVEVGNYVIDLGVVTNLQIVRGGNENTSWTIDGLSTEWEVRLEITPLVNELMMASTNEPLLFCKNEGLLDYLGNFCGFDMLAFNLTARFQLMWTFVASRFNDAISLNSGSVYRRLMENVVRVGGKIFNALGSIIRS